MTSVLKYGFAVCVCLVLAGISSIRATVPGFLEGHLKIVSLKEVELAEETPSKVTTENYANYPLIILSQDGQKEIARVTADENGSYRVALPPGDYVLDVQGRKPKGHVRAKAQHFTVISNQIARVDMDIDTGIR
jgi:hypothetical protein